MAPIVVVLAVPALLLLALLIVCLGTSGPRGLIRFVLWCGGLALATVALWQVGNAVGDRGCDESMGDCFGGGFLGYALAGGVLVLGPVAGCVVEAVTAGRRGRHTAPAT